MAKGFDNRRLGALFLILVAVVFVIYMGEEEGGARNFEKDIVRIDTSAVSRIVIRPKANEEEVVLEKGSEQWKLISNGETKRADASLVRNALSQLKGIEVKRLAARSKEKWAEYDVTDSLATRIRVQEGNETTLDLYLGKFDFNRGPGGKRGRLRSRGGNVSSYVRVAGKNAVYSVSGMLNHLFNKTPSAWEYTEPDSTGSGAGPSKTPDVPSSLPGK